MKYPLVFLLFIVMFLSLPAQDYWSHRYDIDKGSDYGLLVSEFNSSLIIHYKSRCMSLNANCEGLLKLNNKGEKLNVIQIDTVLRSNSIKAMAVNEGLAYLNTHYRPGFQDSSHLFSMLVYDSNLDVVSQKKYGDYTGNHSVSREIEVSEHGIFLSADENGPNFTNFRSPLRKYDFDFSLKWETDVKDTHNFDYNSFGHAKGTIDGGLYRSFPACNQGDDCQGYFQRYDSLGNLLWTYKTDPENPYYFNTYTTVLPDELGIVGKWHEDLLASFDYYSVPPLLFRISADGDLLWQRTIWSPYGVELAINDLFTTKSGNIIALGELGALDYISAFEDSTKYFGGYIACLSPDGDLLWQRRIADHRYQSKYSIFYGGAELENGDLVFTGHIRDSFDIEDPWNIWVVKTDSMGCLVPGCQDTNIFVVSNTEPDKVPRKSADFMLFPNPSTGQVSLVATMSNSLPIGEYHYSIFDQLGREIQAPQQIARPEIIQSIDLSALADGLYFMQVFWNGTVLESMPVVLKK